MTIMEYCKRGTSTFETARITRHYGKSRIPSMICTGESYCGHFRGILYFPPPTDVTGKSHQV